MKPDVDESKFDPKVFRVNLGIQATKMWDASLEYRSKSLSEFFEMAKRVGKKKVSVHSRYADCGMFDVPE